MKHSKFNIKNSSLSSLPSSEEIAARLSQFDAEDNVK